MVMHIGSGLFEAGCSKDSDVGIGYVRQRSKAYLRVCVASKSASMLILARELSRVLRTTGLLTKVAICITITRYTQFSL